MNFRTNDKIVKCKTQYEQDTNMNLSSMPVYIPGNDQLHAV